MGPPPPPTSSHHSREAFISLSKLLRVSREGIRVGAAQERGAVPSWCGRPGLKPEHMHLPEHRVPAGVRTKPPRVRRLGLRGHTLSGEWTFTVMSTVRATAAAGTPLTGSLGGDPRRDVDPLVAAFQEGVLNTSLDAGCCCVSH